MLVVPDYMADNGEGEGSFCVTQTHDQVALEMNTVLNNPRAPGLGGGMAGMPIRYDAIWEFGFLEELVGRNNVILQAEFDALLQEEVRAG